MLISQQVVRRATSSALAALLAMTAACSPGSPASSASQGVDVSSVPTSQIPADGTASADGLVVKDHALGSLPSDPYRSADYRLQSMALDTRIAVCMAEHQLDYPVVSFDWNDPNNTPSKGWSPARTEEQARKYGYHLIPTADGDEKRTAQAFVASQPASYQSQLSSCMDQASADPMFADAVQDDLPFVTGAESNPAARSAMEAWTQCMRSLGIPDLPTDAPGPSPSTMERLGLAGADNTNLADPSTITSDEIAIAVQDARCNAESHYDEILYGLTWVGQQQQVTQHQSEFTARMEKISADRQGFINYIEQHRDVIG